MKDFFKMLFASILGVLIVIMVGFFIVVGVITAMLSMESTPTEIAPNSILRIALDKPIQDRTSDNPFQFINPLSLSINMPLGLNMLVKNIERAKSDPRIKGIYLDLSNLSAGIATIEEIRNALLDYKSSGGFVIAYADNYSQTGYYLATVADKIYMNPYGDFNLIGMSSQVMFYKGLLDKLGVEMQIIRHGKFKSAVEPFMLDQMSAENREQTMAFMGSLWNSVLQTISTSRSISVEELQRMTNQMEIGTAEDALSKGLLDQLYYKDEVIAELCKYTDRANERELKLVNITDYAIGSGAKFSKNKVAVIYASGEIMQGSDGKGVMSTDMSLAIRSARNDSSVKAIVFRINSPGGDAQASEIIARELELAKKVKPVIISMGDVAASGGYWIATPGHTILANHTTITGSIGVFGLVPNVQKGMKNMLGLTVDVTKTNEHADFGNIFRSLTLTEKAYLQRKVEDIYTKFITKVANSRELPVAMVDSIGQGRVWSGNNAFERKLIDEFGGLQDAVKLAGVRANIGTDFRIEELPKEKSPFEFLMNSMSTKLSTYFQKSELEYTFQHYEYVINSINNRGIQARMPYDVEIH